MIALYDDYDEDDDSDDHDHDDHDDHDGNVKLMLRMAMGNYEHVATGFKVKNYLIRLISVSGHNKFKWYL